FTHCTYCVEPTEPFVSGGSLLTPYPVLMPLPSKFVTALMVAALMFGVACSAVSLLPVELVGIGFTACSWNPLNSGWIGATLRSGREMSCPTGLSTVVCAAANVHISS